MPQEKASLVRRFIESGTLPSDTDEERLSKESLTLMSAPFAFAGLAWGIMYFAAGLWLPGWIPFTYGILSVVSILHFAITKRYILFRNSQLLMILVLPFLLQISLGGFIPSSGVVLWAIICPMAALVFFSTRQSLVWFGCFVCLVVVAYLLDDMLNNYFNWEISESFIDALFLLNIVSVSGLVFLVQYHFVQKQRSLKMEVVEQSKKLKELDRVKSNFFANISHEFRTPLTLILGILNKQEKADEDDQIMKRNADRLLQLINQLLDLAKLESGKLEIKKQNIDLNVLARKTGQLFGSAAEEKGIRFKFNSDRLTSERAFPVAAVLADPEQLQKVLTNLISNAVKFCPDGGDIDLIVEEVEGRIGLTISNTGNEIPVDQLSQIFNRFYQVESDSTRGYEGTGIGLALVKEIVEVHDGNILVTSENGRVTFEVRLPKGDSNTIHDYEPLAQQESVKLHTREEIASVEREERPKILVVEDYPDLRQFIVNILRNDYSVVEAVDGEEGVKTGLDEVPDLIISDIMMPKKDGNQLCAELKNQSATDHIPIILLTAKAGKEDKLEGLEQGADDYLTKPFDETELLVRVKNLLQTRKLLQEKYQKEIWLKPKDVKVSSAQEKFLEQLKETVENNLSNESLAAEDLAQAVAMSRSQLHRKLKALTDQSTTEFVRSYRLERGADLLKKGAGSVSEIAYQVGFSSQTYFSSSFQNHFGCSPSEIHGKDVN